MLSFTQLYEVWQAVATILDEEVEAQGRPASECSSQNENPVGLASAPTENAFSQYKKNLIVLERRA